MVSPDQDLPDAEIPKENVITNARQINGGVLPMSDPGFYHELMLFEYEEEYAYEHETAVLRTIVLGGFNGQPRRERLLLEDDDEYEMYHI